MPPKRKSENKSLPARWRFKHGAYFYRVPVGLEHLWDGKKEFRLGATLTEAYRVWADRIEHASDIHTIGQLFDRYACEVVPYKAYETQQSNQRSLSRLRPVFGHVPLKSLKPSHAYKYLDLAGREHGNHTANRDFEVLSHVFSKAVEWGLVDINPVKGQVRKLKVNRRERYVEDWEIAQALTVAGDTIRAYIAVKLLTGLRRGDILRLTVDDLKDDGIYVKPHKTSHTSGVSLIISWSPELREAVDAALSARARSVFPWLFCTKQGDCFINPDTSRAPAFDSLWQRFMAKVLSQTEVKERFQEKDLRKKTASDMPLDLASALLGHSTVATTKKHYRLKPDVVKPHSMKK